MLRGGQHHQLASCEKSDVQEEQPGMISYRYNYTDNYKRICAYGRGRPNAPTVLAKAYKARLQISDIKKKDLMKLCNHLAIPEEFHNWYRAVPTSSRTKDQQPEPAVEDSGDDDDDEFV